MTDFRYTRPTMLRSLSIVLPAYNEADNIATAIKRCITAARSVTNEYEIIVVNDGSKDDTAARVRAIQRKCPLVVRLLDSPTNLGYGPTVHRGLDAARKEWVFFTDADNQFDPCEITKLIPYTDEYDFVVGKRVKRQDSFRQRRNARIFNYAVRVFFGIRVKDVDCAFKLMKRRVLQALPILSESAMINTEILHRARKQHVRIKEVTVTHYPRQHGESTGANPEVIKKAMQEFFVLRWKLLGVPRTLMGINTWVVAAISLLAVVTATVWSYQHGTILAYGDAEAHLNIAKRVIDSLTPGYAQLGGIWLPLPHLLIVPFVTNDWLWRSGLGGSIPSIIAFVWLCVFGYKLAFELTGNFVASYIAPLVFIANPNSLYMASTPMTETLLLSTFTTSAYYFVRWLRSYDLFSLVLASFFAVLATLSRYDGWALVCVEAALIGLYLVSRRLPVRVVEGMLLLYSFVAFSGILLWLLWNKLIFNNFLYFANSVYGSKAQQEFFLKAGYLPTYHNIAKSAIYFLEDMRLVIGLPILLLTLLGVVLFTARLIHTRRYRYLAFLAIALTPLAFYVISLYFGQASLILPAFAKPGAQYSISNVRYGVQMLPAVAIFLAVLASRFRKLIPIFILAVIAQSFYFIYTGTVTTYVDGTAGLSSQAVAKGTDAPAVEQFMRQHYDNGLVLMDDYRRPIGIVESGVPMDRFIGSGNKPYWNESFDNPGKYAKWLIIQKVSTDAVWTGLKRKDLIDTEFVPVFSRGGLFVYEKQPTEKDVVARSGQHLALNSEPYVINGVNSYDMLAQNDGVIEQRMQQFASLKYNTVRLWCFNQQGRLTPQNFHGLDVVMREAEHHNLRIVCVLGNTLSDYGGPSIFGATSQRDFFTSSASIAAYEVYISSILTHVDPYTHKQLSQSTYILAWELINEPRVEGVDNSTLVANWTTTVGEYLLSLDQSHMVSPGTEGFTSTRPGQYYNQQHGASIEDICNLEVISLCSAHLYPKYISPAGSPGRIDPAGIGSTTANWRAVADKLNKPLYVGEVGFDISESHFTSSDRTAFFTQVNASVKRNKLDGALIWNVGNQADGHYTLQYGDPILQSWGVTP